MASAGFLEAFACAPWKREGPMKWVFLIITHLWAFVLGIHFAEWSARENHATVYAAGRWLRSWFV